MVKEGANIKPLLVFTHLLFILFLISVFFSFRAITSITAGILFGAAFFFGSPSRIRSTRDRPALLFIAGCVLFFLLQILALTYTDDMKEGWSQIRMKIGLIILPIGLYGLGEWIRDRYSMVIFYFSALLTLSLLYCLVIAGIQYGTDKDSSVFFYHSLVSPLGLHAVLTSVYGLAAWIFLAESLRKKESYAPRFWYIIVLCFLTLFLVLLSSKLVIGFFIMYILFSLFRLIKKGSQRKIAVGAGLLLCSGLIVLLVSKNPVSERFADLVRGEKGLVSENKNSPADYFNGLQFRLLQWKIVPEILNEEKGWLAGVGPGDAQQLLDKKYISRNMYVGDPSRGDRGFLGYVTHNLFLETLLQNGLGGLTVIVLILFILIKMAVQKRDAASLFITLLVIAFCFTESVLETQYGIVLFSFLPLLVYFKK